VPGPHALTVRNSAVRLARPDHSRISSPCDDLRARRCRVHRIPRSTFVTIAIRPSWSRRDARDDAFDLPDEASASRCGRLARRAICAWLTCVNCPSSNWSACQALPQHLGLRIRPHLGGNRRVGRPLQLLSLAGHMNVDHVTTELAFRLLRLALTHAPGCRAVPPRSRPCTRYPVTTRDQTISAPR
jgi:hypothetical protein